ncbi:alpha/beta fold hydrolase [Mesorhizobium zhangyense]|nr:alpha/beta hydrolase [Mesorhizobium zhangyense]
MTEEVTFRNVVGRNGIRLRLAVAGEGPLVLMVHGFPESWYSWRHQITAIAGAGYMAAALDVRGYGGSDKPEEIAAYSVADLAGDIVDVIDALDLRGAVIVGHDWGAVQVYAAAIRHPEKIRAVVGISVPASKHPQLKPSESWKKLYADTLFYQVYFQKEGAAEAEFEADLPRFVRIFFTSLSADASIKDNVLIRPKHAERLLDGLPDPVDLPNWLSQADVDFYAESFRASGLRGPLNRYRCADIDWEQMLPYAERNIDQPSLFIGGIQEPTRYMIPGIDRFDDPVPRMTDIRGIHMLDGVGHWVQQEAPEKTSELIVGFLRSL